MSEWETRVGLRPARVDNQVAAKPQIVTYKKRRITIGKVAIAACIAALIGAELYRAVDQNDPIEDIIVDLLIVGGAIGLAMPLVTAYRLRQKRRARL